MNKEKKGVIEPYPRSVIYIYWKYFPNWIGNVLKGNQLIKLTGNWAWSAGWTNAWECNAEVISGNDNGCGAQLSCAPENNAAPRSTVLGKENKRLVGFHL